MHVEQYSNWHSNGWEKLYSFIWMYSYVDFRDERNVSR